MGTRTHNVWTLDGCIVGAASNYQGYIYDVAANECQPTNDRMRARWAAVCDFFPNMVTGKTVLDIGAHQGFFCFKALEHGAAHVTGVEFNRNFYQPLANALKQLPVPSLEWIQARWPAGHTADVVLMLSTIHHLYPTLSLEEIVASLAACTGDLAIVDFPTEADENVRQQDHDQAAYNLAAFHTLVVRSFNDVESVPGYSPTRQLFILRMGVRENDK